MSSDNHDQLKASDGLTKLALILQNWKVLLISMLVGAVIGQAIFSLFPPPFKARAVMIMDQNLEEVFPAAPDREIFYFLERETQKLEAIAWSDVVLEEVIASVDGYSLDNLRSGSLILSQPYDGGWNMYGVANNQDIARKLANAWADSFSKVVRNGVENARLLEQAKKELESIPAAELGTSERAKTLNIKITELEKNSLGIHPEIEVYRSEATNIKVMPSVKTGSYIFVGAICGFVLGVLSLALWRREDVG